MNNPPPRPPPPFPPGHPPPPQPQHGMGMGHFPPNLPPPPGPPPMPFPHHPPGHAPSMHPVHPPMPPPGAPMPLPHQQQPMEGPKTPIIFSGHITLKPPSKDEIDDAGKDKKSSDKGEQEKKQNVKDDNSQQYVAEIFLGKAMRIEGVHIVPNNITPPGVDGLVGRTKPELPHNFKFMMRGRDVYTSEIVTLWETVIHGGVRWHPISSLANENMLVDYLVIDGDFEEVTLLVHGEEDITISKQLKRNPYYLPPYPHYLDYTLIPSEEIEQFMHKLRQDEKEWNDGMHAEANQMRQQTEEVDNKILLTQHLEDVQFREYYHNLARGEKSLTKDQEESLQLLIGRISMRHGSALVPLNVLADLVEQVFSINSSDATSMDGLRETTIQIMKLNQTLRQCWTASTNTTFTAIDKRGIVRDMIGEDGASMLCQAVVKLLRDVFDLEEISSQANFIRSLHEEDRKEIISELEPAIIRCVKYLLVNEFTATEFANAGGCEVLLKILQQLQAIPFSNTFKEGVLECLIESMDKVDFPQTMHLIVDGNTDIYQSMLYLMASLRVSSSLTPTISLLINLTTFIGHLMDWKGMIESSLTMEVPRLIEAIRDLYVENEKMTVATSADALQDADDDELGFGPSSDFNRSIKGQDSPAHVAISRLTEWKEGALNLLEKLNQSWSNATNAFIGIKNNKEGNDNDLELKCHEIMFNLLHQYKFLPSMIGVVSILNLLDEFIELLDWSIHHESYQIRGLVDDLHNHVNQWSDRLLFGVSNGRSNQYHDQFVVFALKNLSSFQVLSQQFHQSRNHKNAMTRSDSQPSGGGLARLIREYEVIRFLMVSMNQIVTSLLKNQSLPANENHLDSQSLCLLQMLVECSQSKVLLTSSSPGSHGIVLKYFGIELASLIQSHVKKIVEAVTLSSSSKRNSKQVDSGSIAIVHYLLQLLNVLIFEASGSVHVVALVKALSSVSTDGFRSIIQSAYDSLALNRASSEDDESVHAADYLSTDDLNILKKLIALLNSMTTIGNVKFEDHDPVCDDANQFLLILSESKHVLQQQALNIPLDLISSSNSSILIQRWFHGLNTLSTYGYRNVLLPINSVQIWSFVKDDILALLKRLDAVVLILLQRVQCAFGPWKSMTLTEEEADQILKIAENPELLMTMLSNALLMIHFLTSWCANALAAVDQDKSLVSISFMEGSDLYAKMYFTFSSSIWNYQFAKSETALGGMTAAVQQIQKNLVELLRFATLSMLTASAASRKQALSLNSLDMKQTFPSLLSETLSTGTSSIKKHSLELLVLILEGISTSSIVLTGGIVQRWSEFSDEDILESLGTLLTISMKTIFTFDHSTSENDDKESHSSTNLCLRLIQCMMNLEGTDGALTTQIAKAFVLELRNKVEESNTVSSSATSSSTESDKDKEKDKVMEEGRTALKTLSVINILTVLRVIEKTLHHQPTLIIPLVNGGLLGVLKSILTTSTATTSTTVSDSTGSVAAGLALIAVQVLNTIYRKLESMRIFFVNQSSVSTYDKEKDSIVMTMSIIGIILVETIPPLLLKYQDSVTFLQQAVVSIHLLPASVYLEKFFQTLSTVGHGFSLEFLTIKLWIAFEESFQYLHEATDIRKQVMMFQATALKDVDENDVSPFTDDEANQLLFEAHSQFTLAVIALRSILDLLVWGYESQKLGLSTLTKALRTSLADPKKVIIRYQKGYTMWMIGFIQLVEQVIDQLNQDKKKKRTMLVMNVGGMNHNSSSSFLLSALSTSSVSTTASTSSSSSSTSQLFANNSRQQEDFESHHLLITTMMKVLVEIVTKVSRYQLTKEEKIRIPLIKASTIESMSSTGFEERWERLKQCHLMDQELIEEENNKNGDGEEGFAFDEGFDELPDGEGGGVKKNSSSSVATNKQYIPMKALLEVSSFQSGSIDGTGKKRQSLHRLLAHSTENRDPLLQASDADNLIHYDFRQQHFKSWNGVDTTFKNVEVNIEEVLQVLHGINQPFEMSGGCILGDFDFHQANDSATKKRKAQGGGKEGEDAAPLVGTDVAESKQDEDEKGNEKAEEGDDEEEKKVVELPVIEEKSLLRLLKRRRLAQLTLPSEELEELDNTLFERLTAIPEPELPPPAPPSYPPPQHVLMMMQQQQHGGQNDGDFFYSDVQQHEGMDSMMMMHEPPSFNGSSSQSYLHDMNSNNMSGEYGVTLSMEDFELIQMLIQKLQQGQALEAQEEAILAQFSNDPQMIEQFERMQKQLQSQMQSLQSMDNVNSANGQQPPMMLPPPPPQMNLPPSMDHQFSRGGSGRGGRGGGRGFDRGQHFQQAPMEGGSDFRQPGQFQGQGQGQGQHGFGGRGDFGRGGRGGGGRGRDFDNSFGGRGGRGRGEGGGRGFNEGGRGGGRGFQQRFNPQEQSSHYGPGQAGPGVGVDPGFGMGIAMDGSGMGMGMGPMEMNNAPPQGHMQQQDRVGSHRPNSRFQR